MSDYDEARQGMDFSVPDDIEDAEVGGCCATQVIEDFCPDDYLRCLDRDDVNEAFKARMDHIVDRAIHDDKSILVCTVNTNQQIMAECLEDYGFSSTPWAKRPISSNRPGRTRVKLFTKLTHKED